MVRRPRVTALLAAARQRRATLVVAGAGYGKTTAVGEVAAGGASRWVRLRPADAQAESLAALIAGALGESPSPGRSAIAAATGADDRQVLAERRAALLCELAEALDDDLRLVIDGLECIGDDQAASHLLRVLSLEAPRALHLVLSGRHLPNLGLGDAQGRGELLEVTARDLSFTVAETAELVGLRLAGASSDLAQECWSLTEGWPAALQLLLDRLERLDPADHGRELERLRHSRGQLWKAFAQELVAGEDSLARRILSVASVAHRVDVRLLDGVAVGAAADDLESLRERGLLVEAGAPGYYRLSPVLAGAAAGHESSGGPDPLRTRVARWLEDHSRLGDALECHAEAAAEAARPFLARCGPALVRTGAAARLVEVLRRHGTGGDSRLDAVLAEALQAVGDWDAAVDLFSRVEQSTGARGLPAGVAWRYGWLLYLRGQSGAFAAERFARQAEAQARATDDRAALAESIELQGAARIPGDDGRLRSAIDLWDDVGNPVGAARARLALAILTGDPQPAEAARRALGAMGVVPALGVPGLLAASRGHAREVAIVALGRFTVLRSGEPVPMAAWQSRKARDLLKLLVARRGHPVTRDAAAEAMWPGEDPEPLGNRLSVALSTIRKVLDPARRHPPDHYLVADARTIALRLDHVDVDLTEFLQVADEAIDLMTKGDRTGAAAPLRRARQVYAGDFLEEDLYEEWAVEAREEARARLVMVLRLLARLAADQGDDESAGQYLGQLLEREPYDEDAWLALIAGQLRLRRHGEARRRYAAYARRMGELYVVPVALSDAASWRP